MIYLDQLRTIFINLRDENILQKMKSKEIQAHKLAFMTHQEMSPEKWHKLIEDKKLETRISMSPNWRHLRINSHVANVVRRSARIISCKQGQQMSR